MKNTKIFQYYQDDNPDNIPLEFRKFDYMSTKKTQDVLRSSSVSAGEGNAMEPYSMFHQDQTRLSQEMINADFVVNMVKKKRAKKADSPNKDLILDLSSYRVESKITPAVDDPDEVLDEKTKIRGGTKVANKKDMMKFMNSK